MANKISDKYFIKLKEGDNWQDVTALVDGINILSVSGFNEKGEAQNIYTADWINSQVEDFMVTTKDEDGKDVVVHANVDLTMTFIAGTRYSTNKDVDTQTAYDNFVDYICNNGDFYIRSLYAGKFAHVTCLKGVKIIDEKLHRGINSYIMASATLHTLDAPKKAT